MDGDITTEPFIKSGFSFGVGGCEGRVAAMLLTSFFDHMQKNIYVKTCIAVFWFLLYLYDLSRHDHNMLCIT